MNPASASARHHNFAFRFRMVMASSEQMCPLQIERFAILRKARVDYQISVEITTPLNNRILLHIILTFVYVTVDDVVLDMTPNWIKNIFTKHCATPKEDEIDTS
jgi:hypothetical protein